MSNHEELEEDIIKALARSCAQLESAVEYAADAFDRAGNEHACDYCRADAAAMRRAFGGRMINEAASQRDAVRAQAEALADALDALTAASEEFFRPNSPAAPVWNARAVLHAYRPARESS